MTRGSGADLCVRPYKSQQTGRITGNPSSVTASGRAAFP